MRGGAKPYQPCQVAGVYLDVVYVVLQDSWEGPHGGAVAFLPEGHGEGHHPPHALIHLHPLQGCIDASEREREQVGPSIWSWSPKYKGHYTNMNGFQEYKHL